MKFKRQSGEIRAGNNVHACLGAQEMLGRKKFSGDDVVLDFETWPRALRPAHCRSHCQDQTQNPGGKHPPRFRRTAWENTAKFTNPIRVILAPLAEPR